MDIILLMGWGNVGGPNFVRWCTYCPIADDIPLIGSHREVGIGGGNVAFLARVSTAPFRILVECALTDLSDGFLAQMDCLAWSMVAPHMILCLFELMACIAPLQSDRIVSPCSLATDPYTMPCTSVGYITWGPGNLHATKHTHVALGTERPRCPSRCIQHTQHNTPQ